MLMRRVCGHILIPVNYTTNYYFDTGNITFPALLQHTLKAFLLPAKQLSLIMLYSRVSYPGFSLWHIMDLFLLVIALLTSPHTFSD